MKIFCREMIKMSEVERRAKQTRRTRPPNRKLSLGTRVQQRGDFVAVFTSFFLFINHLDQLLEVFAI